MNYYNDHEPYAAQWLRNLIAAKLIPQGEVDERDIQDISTADLVGYTQCHFFAGIGGWSYALQLAGWPADEPVWTGSCPCQPFSTAGLRQGEADSRHVWPEFRRLISECRPATIFGEQVTSQDGLQWFAGVRADLEAMDYAVGCADLCAASVKAPHKRQRLYWVALGDPSSQRSQRPDWSQQHIHRPWQTSIVIDCGEGIFRRTESSIQPVVDGIPSSLGRGRSRMERMAIRAARAYRIGSLRGYGNAIVPQVAAEFIRAFMEVSHERPDQRD